MKNLPELCNRTLKAMEVKDSMKGYLFSYCHEICVLIGFRRSLKTLTTKPTIVKMRLGPKTASAWQA